MFGSVEYDRRVVRKQSQGTLVISKKKTILRVRRNRYIHDGRYNSHTKVNTAAKTDFYSNTVKTENVLVQHSPIVILISELKKKINSTVIGHYLICDDGR